MADDKSKEEILEELTDKQRRFCEEYIFDWNATRAAIAAGYSENTAKEIGYENLTKPHIKAYIEEIQKDLSKVAGISALKNIREFEKIAYSSLHNYKDNWMTLKEWEEISEDDKAAILEITTTSKTIYTKEGEPIVTEIIKFKLHDKQKALDSLNKMLGYNAPDKVDVTSDGEKIEAVTIVKLPDNQREKE